MRISMDHVDSTCYVDDNQVQATQLEIWEDEPVLHFLRTHDYLPTLEALESV